MTRSRSTSKTRFLSTGKKTAKPGKRPLETAQDGVGVPEKRSKTGKTKGSFDNADPELTKVTTATTFGLEFEFVLAFHEDKLLEALNLYAIDASIVKNCDYDIQRELVKIEKGQSNRPYMCRDLWPSWLLNVPLDDETHAKQADRRTYQVSPTDGWIRRYRMEPLLVARTALGADRPVNVIGWMDNAISPTKPPSRDDPDPNKASFGRHDDNILLRSMVPDYNKWNLTNDYTLVPVRKSHLRERLCERGRELEFGGWDSYGLELITPIMSLHHKNAAFAQIGAYLSALNNQGQVDSMTSVWATTHVHIGFDKDTREELAFTFFQHVAFILLCYERIITRCFPRRSCGVEAPQANPIVSAHLTQPESDAAQEVNVVQADDEAVRSAEERYTGDEGVRSNHQYMQEYLAGDLGKESHEIGWNDMRDFVFSEQDNLADIIMHMQMPKEPSDYLGQRHRGYMVNWCNIYSIWTGEPSFKTIKPTLEFRQHPCSIDAGIIKHWILLLEAVMRLAAQLVQQQTRYASSLPLDTAMSYAERDASKYPNNGLPFGTVGAYVNRLLNLDESERRYWEGRYDEYKNDRPE